MKRAARPLSMCKNAGSAADFFPKRISLPALREASKGCRGCDLYYNATQTVFGEGPTDALVMLIGEQPGDQEDQAGKPFIGPAGYMLNSMLEKSSIPRGDVYVTNVVKHFKFEPRAKRRIHSKPNAREVAKRAFLKDMQLVARQLKEIKFHHRPHLDQQELRAALPFLHQLGQANEHLWPAR